MKKLISLVLVALFVSSVALATEVTVGPNTSVNFYKDAKTKIGLGVEATVSQLPKVPEQVSLTTGLQYTGTVVKDTAVDLNILKLSEQVGYDVIKDSKITVTPYLALDGYLVDAKGNNTADNAVGMSLGVKTAYKLSEDWSVKGGAGYSFASTDVNGSEVCLDGVSFNGAISYKF